MLPPQLSCTNRNSVLVKIPSEHIYAFFRKYQEPPVRYQAFQMSAPDPTGFPHAHEILPRTIWTLFPLNMILLSSCFMCIWNLFNKCFYSLGVKVSNLTCSEKTLVCWPSAFWSVAFLHFAERKQKLTGCDSTCKCQFCIPHRTQQITKLVYRSSAEATDYRNKLLFRVSGGWWRDYCLYLRLCIVAVWLRLQYEIPWFLVFKCQSFLFVTASS